MFFNEIGSLQIYLLTKFHQWDSHFESRAARP